MKTKILFILCLLTGIMFINAGLNKFFNYMPMPEEMPQEVLNQMTAMGQLGWLLPLVALAEIIGGMLFVIPKFRALGALILFPVLVGIIVYHIVVAPASIFMGLILFAIVIWAMVEDKLKFIPFIK